MDKPQGWTSHDVVAKLRNAFRVDKVGHCGTLDPMATGLLVILLGKATKLSNVLMSHDKRYEGDITLGVETDSYDAEGEVLETKEVPVLLQEQMEDLFAGFRGDQYQVPPMVSAKKIGGKALYELARKGQTVEREPRFIHVYEFVLTRFEPPVIGFRLFATKGTYVRSIAHDLGVKIGCGAHLSRLRRTQSGAFKVEDALPLEEILKFTTARFEQTVVPLHKLTAAA